MTYTGGAAPRTLLGGNVYTASDEPENWTVELHNEMAYLNTIPDVILFYCDKQANPGCGGETSLTLTKDVQRHLPPDEFKKLDKLGFMYTRFSQNKNYNLYKGMSWQKIFNTERREDVEKFFQDSQGGEKCTWSLTGDLTVSWKGPAFRNHPITGEKLFVNQGVQLHGSLFKSHPFWCDYDLPYSQYPWHSYYGDGSDIPEELLDHVRSTWYSAGVGFQMMPGDLLVLDNWLAMHGRMGYEGDRKLLALLGKRKESIANTCNS